jgi:hypothetical protein
VELKLTYVVRRISYLFSLTMTTRFHMIKIMVSFGLHRTVFLLFLSLILNSRKVLLITLLSWPQNMRLVLFQACKKTLLKPLIYIIRSSSALEK